MSEDSLAEMFYEKVISEGNPVPYLVGFFMTLFNLNNNKEELFKVFGKLYKVYGREICYFAILDCYDIETIDVTKPYGILVYFCKNRLAKSSKPSYQVNLDKVAEKNLAEMAKQRKYKLPNVLEDKNE